MLVYKFIEYREINNTTSTPTLKEEINYTYDTNWVDQLTQYKDYDITYDEIGNPLTIVKDNVTYYSFTWEKGRQLESMYVYRGDLGLNDIDITYKYDDNGIRLSKEVTDRVTDVTTTTSYKLVGDKITYESNGTDNIHYTYDAEGNVILMTLNDVTYYYEKNMTGDIIGLIDTNGNRVVSYEYDSWGKIISITDTSNIDLGNKNPFRYKGYYYDNETGYYYLNSRYYNPDMKRFINVDETMGEVGNIVGNNMYAYAVNNPINYVDYDGYWALALVEGGIISSGYSVGGANIWNPIGWAVLGITTITVGIMAYNQYQKYQSNALTNAKIMISSASVSPMPLPPNKGGKGTQTSSKTLYNKNGARIDVENPGNRPGQIHLQKNGIKYYYNIQEQVFRTGSSAGKLAPKTIQEMLKNKEVIKAIAKGLTYLGY